MTNFKDFHSRFGFHSTPFTREISIKDSFKMEPHAIAIHHLLRVVDMKMSAAIIAPAGTGKTVLLRTLVDQLSEVRYRVHYVKVTDLCMRDFCQEIATAIDIEPTGNYPALVRRLQDRFTQALDIDGVRPVLILDEAHDIRPNVLGILRILTNFDMDSRLVVSVILAGQAPLSKLLRHVKMGDVASRLSHVASLRLLSPRETKDYVTHRCRIAGATTAPFDTSAMSAIHEIARGNLRAIDYLALKALELAHDADCSSLDQNHIAQARTMLCP